MSINFYSKYIKNRQWQGRLIVDGGHGLQPKIMELYNRFGTKKPFYLNPQIKINNLDQIFGIRTNLVEETEDLPQDLDFSKKSEMESFYLIIIPPTKFEAFITLSNAIRKYCGVEIIGEFYSIDVDNKYDSPLYKLDYNQSPSTNNIPQYTLSTGQWIPDFRSVNLKAGWLDMPEFYIEEKDGSLVDGIKELDKTIKEQNDGRTEESTDTGTTKGSKREGGELGSTKSE